MNWQGPLAQVLVGALMGHSGERTHPNGSSSPQADAQMQHMQMMNHQVNRPTAPTRGRNVKQTLDRRGSNYNKPSTDGSTFKGSGFSAPAKHKHVGDGVKPFSGTDIHPGAGMFPIIKENAKNSEDLFQVKDLGHLIDKTGFTTHDLNDSLLGGAGAVARNHAGFDNKLDHKVGDLAGPADSSKDFEHQNAQEFVPQLAMAMFPETKSVGKGFSRVGKGIERWWNRGPETATEAAAGTSSIWNPAARGLQDIKSPASQPWWRANSQAAMDHSTYKSHHEAQNAMADEIELERSLHELKNFFAQR